MRCSKLKDTKKNCPTNRKNLSFIQKEYVQHYNFILLYLNFMVLDQKEKFLSDISGSSSTRASSHPIHLLLKVLELNPQ